jgi:glycosyltransferase involved in cell wall biosynthesis
MIRIPYGIDPAPAAGELRAGLIEELGLPADATLIGHVGRLTKRKGHHLLLEALADLKDLLSASKAAVLFVGEGEEEANLRRRTAALGLEGFVRYLGHRENGRELIGTLDLLVLPSTVETQPFVILEAMAAGVPVLSTSIYGIPDMVVPEVTGLLVEAGRILPLRLALKRLLVEDATRRRMGRAGLERFNEHFRVDRMAARTEAVYRARNGVGP